MANSNLIPFSYTRALENNRSNSVVELLDGLAKKEIGFVYGIPGLGKTNLSLAISYELATGTPIIGLLAKPGTTYRVLYVPYEDKEFNVNSRIVEQTSKTFSEDQKRLMEANFALYTDYSPLLSLKAPSGSILPSVERLVEAAKEFDIVFIDTARKAMGGVSESDSIGDQSFRLALNHIAENADVAIIVNHHLTKIQVSDSNAVNSTGGSGLSSCQSESKFHLLLSQTKKLKANNQFSLVHTRHNYIKPENTFDEDSPLILSSSEGGYFSALELPSRVRNFVSEVQQARVDEALRKKQQTIEVIDSVKDIPLDEEIIHQLDEERKQSDASSHNAKVDAFDEMFLPNDK